MSARNEFTRLLRQGHPIYPALLKSSKDWFALAEALLPGSTTAASNKAKTEGRSASIGKRLYSARDCFLNAKLLAVTEAPSEKRLDEYETFFETFKSEDRFLACSQGARSVFAAESIGDLLAAMEVSPEHNTSAAAASSLDEEGERIFQYPFHHFFFPGSAKSLVVQKTRFFHNHPTIAVVEFASSFAARIPDTSFSMCPLLRSVWVENSWAIGDECFCDNASLRTLDFYHCHKMDRMGRGSICRNPVLERVSLGPIKNLEDDCLKDNPSLRFVDLRLCKVSSLRENMLSGNPSVRQIWLPQELCACSLKWSAFPELEEVTTEYYFPIWCGQRKGLELLQLLKKVKRTEVVKASSPGLRWLDQVCYQCVRVWCQIAAWLGSK